MNSTEQEYKTSTRRLTHLSTYANNPHFVPLRAEFISLQQSIKNAEPILWTSAPLVWLIRLNLHTSDFIASGNVTTL